MKKSLKYLSLSLLVPALFIFSGCKNEDKTLAKNLDNTITSLIYSVSSLDFADTNMLDGLNQTETQNNISEYDFNRPINIDSPESDNSQDTDNDNSQNDNNYQPNPRPRRYQDYPQNAEYYREPKRQRKPFGRTPIARIDEQTSKNNNRTYRTERIQEEINKARNINNNYNNNQNQISTYTNQTTDSETRLVSFSTEEISKNDSLIREKISNLINERSNLLLYINDLYKGNVSLSIASKNAINAYMNIIKDNTAYLNQNKGIVTNQLSEANKLYEENSNSSLINAYIIRTNEAVASRIVKIESSISAMNAISQIIQGSLKSSSPNFNINNLNNNNNKNTDNNISILDKNKNNQIINNQTTPENENKQNIDNNCCQNSDNNCCENQNNKNTTIAQNLDIANNNTEPNNTPTLRSNNINIPLQNQDINFDKPIVDNINNNQTNNLEKIENINNNSYFQSNKKLSTNTLKNISNDAQSEICEDCKNQENNIEEQQIISEQNHNNNEINNDILSDKTLKEKDKKPIKFDNEINPKIRENQQEIYKKQNQKSTENKTHNSDKETPRIQDKMSNCFIENKKKSYDKNLRTAR